MLIGTPGRIIDFYKQGVFDLRQVQVCVLDEADRMFDLGFIADIRYMLRKMPEPAQRQSMLFSATLSQRVLELAYEHMNSPELIRIEPDRITADKVRQLIYFPATEEKIPLLIGLLRKVDAHRTMVFVNTRRQADRLEEVLRANHINAQAVSGDVPQNKRLRYLKEFHSGELAVLIATDVASRGLHIPDVSHVYNFDLPQDCADYVHRIGRTARAGAEGDAISFGCEDYAVCLPDIENYIGHKIPVAAVSRELLATDVVFPRHKPREDAPPRRGGGGGGGGRGPRPGGGGRPGGAVVVVAGADRCAAVASLTSGCSIRRHPNCRRPSCCRTSCSTTNCWKTMTTSHHEASAAGRRTPCGARRPCRRGYPRPCRAPCSWALRALTSFP